MNISSQLSVQARLEIRILEPGAISLKIARKLPLVHFLVHKFIWEFGYYTTPQEQICSFAPAFSRLVCRFEIREYAINGIKSKNNLIFPYCLVKCPVVHLSSRRILQQMDEHLTSGSSVFAKGLHVSSEQFRLNLIVYGQIDPNGLFVFNIFIIFRSLCKYWGSIFSLMPYSSWVLYSASHQLFSTQPVIGACSSCCFYLSITLSKRH